MSDNGGEQHLDLPENAGNPPTPTEEAGNGDRPTRSITVSIQYSYFNPANLANLNPNQSNEAVEGNQEVPAGNRPDGALILSFRDVPTSTPQERLESIISIAAELAMRRFSDMMSQPKGITKEQFEQLSVLKVRDLPDQENTVCSICYESYEDELSNILKRARDNDLDGRDGLQKKQRSESPVVIPAQERVPHDGAETGQSANESEPFTYKHSPVELPCGHIFGRECLFKWSQLENSCPLCRHKIVDSGPSNEAANGHAANQNTEAFERIRQALYNTSPLDQAAAGSTGPAGVLGEGNDLQNFTFSRSGIVLLRPDMRGNTAGAPATQTNEAGAATPGEGADEQQTSNPLSFLNGPESRRIQWIPLPMTAIHAAPANLFNNANAETDSAETTQQERSPNERLRTILNNIFNVTHAVNTLNPSSEPEPGASAVDNIDISHAPAEETASISENSVSDSSATSTSQESTRSTSRRRSFLDHILRITNRRRTRSEDNSSNSGSTSTPFLNSQSVSNMFNTGVASYRNRDGQVSTFHVSDGPLPTPPRADTHSTRDSSNDNEDVRQRDPSRTADGHGTSDNNDTQN